ncbi:MAG: hypothetical protein LBR34_12105, partial [Prevotella sp.]|nr:hypothetical protein [Prevotella sp.]
AVQHSPRNGYPISKAKIYKLNLSFMALISISSVWRRIPDNTALDDSYDNESENKPALLLLSRGIPDAIV